MMNNTFKWSIRFVHRSGLTAPTMLIVSSEKYSEVVKIAARRSALSSYDSWRMEVLDKQPWLERVKRRDLRE